jgi:hypothetical protein
MSLPAITTTTTAFPGVKLVPQSSSHTQYLWLIHNYQTLYSNLSSPQAPLAPPNLNPPPGTKPNPPLNPLPSLYLTLSTSPEPSAHLQPSSTLKAFLSPYPPTAQPFSSGPTEHPRQDKGNPDRRTTWIPREDEGHMARSSDGTHG